MHPGHSEASRLFASACQAPDYRLAEADFCRWLDLPQHGDPAMLLRRLPEAAARRGAAFLDFARRAGLIATTEVDHAIAVAEQRGLHDPAPRDLFAQWGVTDRYQLERIEQRLRELQPIPARG